MGTLRDKYEKLKAGRAGRIYRGSKSVYNDLAYISKDLKLKKAVRRFGENMERQLKPSGNV